MRLLILLGFLGVALAASCPELITLTPYFLFNSTSGFLSMSGNVTYEFGPKVLGCDYEKTPFSESIAVTFPDYSLSIFTNTSTVPNCTIYLDFLALNQKAIFVHRAIAHAVEVVFFDTAPHGVSLSIFAGLDKGSRSKNGWVYSYSRSIWNNYIITEISNFANEGSWTHEYMILPVTNSRASLTLDFSTTRTYTDNGSSMFHNTDWKLIMMIIILFGLLFLFAIILIYVYLRRHRGYSRL